MHPAHHQHLSALRTYWQAHRGFPPMSGLARVLGLASKGGVFKVMRRLVDEGYLTRVEGRRFAPTAKFFASPVLGSVRAGLPQSVQEDLAEPELVSVQERLLPRPGTSSLCRVRGDSMEDAGLRDGDYVVVDSSLLGAAGDVVVAMVDGEVTVKHLHQDDEGWFLEPANPDYAAIRPRSSLAVLGVVTGMFRTYRR